MRRAKGVPGWMKATLGGVGVLALAGVGVFAWQALSRGVSLETVTPARVRAGQRATLRGAGFSDVASSNVVRFDDKPARVLSARRDVLEVEVPPEAVEVGSERTMAVVVRNGTLESKPVTVTVLQAPRLHGLSPLAALPGEQVLLAGGGWGPGATVRFGSLQARTIEVDATRIRVIVPEIAGGPGTAAPVVVTVGGVDSNEAPFVVGQLPLITGVSPAEAAPGDVVQLSGVGFSPNAPDNDVRIAGASSLVVAATGDSLKVVVPRVPAGDPARTIELRVPGNANVGTSGVSVAATAAPLRFVAEPFARPHAVLSTPLGPAFVLAAAAGRSAAERVLEAQQRLNAALPVLEADARLTFEGRGYEASPVVGIAGRPDVLLDVTDEDAAAYNEDWTGLKGRGGAVTRGRLARWWEAVGRDLVLLRLRGERPRFAAALAPEGRVFGQVFDAARRSGKPPLPQQELEAARPAVRDALRLVALRVPAKVAEPVVPGAALPGATPTPPPPRLVLEGAFRGREADADGQIRYVTVSFTKTGGTVTFEGGITFAVPIQQFDQPARDRVRYSVKMRGGERFYSGRWDGEALRGEIASDAAGKEVVGSFELRR